MAIDAFQKAIEIDKDYARPWNGLGNVFKNLKRYQEAINAYHKAIEIDKDYTSPWNGLGNVYFRLERYQDAIDAYQNGIEIDENIDSLWNGLGNVFFSWERYPEAIDAYQKAIRINEDYVYSWYGLANVHSKLGNYQKAIEIYQKSIEIDKNFAGPWNGLANTYLELKQYQKAINAYEKAIEIDRNDAYPWTGLGNAYSGLERYQEAIEAYHKAIKIDKDYATPWHSLAFVYSKLERFQEELAAHSRFYHLAKRENLVKAMPGWLQRLDEKFDVPLLILRIFNEHPELHSSITLEKIYNHHDHTCHQTNKLLQYLRTNPPEVDQLTCLQLEGIITYHLGDCKSAEKIFDDLVDQFEVDLLGQYYLVLSLQSYCEDHFAVLNDAVHKANAYLRDANAGFDIVQLYYAGQIFLMANNPHQALTCFKKSSNLNADFLPALYMTALILHDNEQIEERDRVIVDILNKEAMRPSHGFLKATSPDMIDITSPYWHAPFQKYAYALEISDAILLVYDWIEKNRSSWMGNHPSINEISDKNDNYPKKSLMVWEFTKKSELIISKCLDEASTYQIEQLRNQLTEWYIQLSNWEEATGDLLIRLANYAEQKFNDSEAERFLILVHYFLLRKQLSVQDAQLLSCYCLYKMICNNKTGEITEKVIDGIIGATISSFLSYQFVNAPIQGIFFTGAGTGAWIAIKELAKKGLQQNEESPKFAEFKANFYHYVDKVQSELSREFNKNYPK